MAGNLLSQEVSDLCLGKPPLKSLSLTATIGDTLYALKNSDETFLSVWNCDHSSKPTSDQSKQDHHVSGGGGGEECRCVGKVCMVDVICYLCKDDNLLCPSDALKAPVSAILSKNSGVVMHVDPSSRLIDAIDLILHGAQNLVIPIKRSLSSTSRRKQHQKLSSTTIHNGREYCWLTQEDIVRFLLSSIGIFSPISALSIDTLKIINTEVKTIDYYSPASSALPAISQSLQDQTSVAVVDGEGGLIGELSPSTISCCDETVAAAITTVSSGDLMAYIDGGGPPEDLVRVVIGRLRQKGLEAMLQEYTNSVYIGNTSLSSSSSSSSSYSSSSDEESGNTPVTKLKRSYSRSMSYSARMVRRAEAIICHPKSSLVAVMIQAIAHRVNYVWVVEDDCSLVGIVTFVDMLNVFRENVETMA